MAVLLPFLALVLFYCVGRLRGHGVRLSAMIALGVFGAVVALGTEFLSLFSAVTFGGLMVFWSIVVLVSVALCIKMRASAGDRQHHEPWPLPATFAEVLTVCGILVVFGGLATFFGISSIPPREVMKSFSAVTSGGLMVFGSVLAFVGAVLCIKTKAGVGEPKEDEPLSWMVLVVITVVLIFFGILCWIAWSFAPNTWDSMTYHMSRVAHWEQYGSVHPYATHNLVQINMSPLAEYVILHLQVLSGTDRFANFVQLFAAFGSVLGVSLITKRLGANRRGQVLAAVLCATLPMGIMQATSTQNDYVLALWLVLIACWAPLTRADAIDMRLAGWLGVVLGLAVLTKGPAFIYATPFVLLFVVLAVLKKRWHSWKVLLIPTLTCLLIIFGHYFRNYELLDSPLAVRSGHYSNEPLGLHPLVSNLVRNTAMHLSLPSADFADRVEGGTIWFHNLLGWDVHDPSMTFGGFPFSVSKMHIAWNSEDAAPNPVHTVLIGLAWLCALSIRRIRRLKPLMIYGLVVVVAIGLYCFLMKWQIWGSRLQLSLFILSMPFVATVFTVLPLRRLITVLMIAMLIYAFPWHVHNRTRPLPDTVGNHVREQDYFRTQHPSLFHPYRDVTNLILNKGYAHVGIIGFYKIGEYPLWALLRQDGKVEPWIEHIWVENQSRVLSDQSSEPDAILVFTKHGNEKITSVLKSRVPESYVPQWEGGPFFLYEKR